MQAVEGNRDALDALLRYFGPQVRRRLSIESVWRDTLELADVMQVTYLEAFLRIGDLSGRTTNAFYRWLMRIAENNLRDAIKELQRAKRPDPRRRLRGARVDQSTILLLEQIGCTTATASRCAADREAVGILEIAVERLPEAYRRVIRLYDLEGNPVDDVARVLGKSPGAVYMLRARAHDRLRDLLGDASEFFSDCA